MQYSCVSFARHCSTWSNAFDLTIVAVRFRLHFDAVIISHQLKLHSRNVCARPSAVFAHQFSFSTLSVKCRRMKNVRTQKSLTETPWHFSFAYSFARCICIRCQYRKSIAIGSFLSPLANSVIYFCRSLDQKVIYGNDKSASRHSRNRDHLILILSHDERRNARIIYCLVSVVSRWNIEGFIKIEHLCMSCSHERPRKSTKRQMTSSRIDRNECDLSNATSDEK